MKENTGQLITIKFTDKKKTISGFIIDYSEDWILLRLNSFDYVVDGYVIVRNKNIEKYIRTESEEFTENIIRLKNLKLGIESKIPLDNLQTILEFLTSNYGIFLIQTKRDSAVYLGKLYSIDDDELAITFLNTRGIWENEMIFKTRKIRVIEFDTDYINSLKLIAEK